MKNIKEFVNLTDFTTDKFLAINSCGFGRYITDDETVLRTNGRKDYHIIYVTKGKCRALSGGNEVVLEKGSVLLYKPGEKHLYSYEKNSETFWIHFAGTAAEELCEVFDGKRILKPGYNLQLCEIFGGIINNFTPRTDNLISVSYLVQFCARSKMLADNFMTSTDERIEYIKNYINENYADNHLLEDYASMCNLSVTRFSHLFKSVTGTSPHRYLLDARIRQVKYLLTYSDMNIEEIAEKTGFDDPLYLSRLFKKYAGISPQQYTKIYR